MTEFVDTDGAKRGDDEQERATLPPQLDFSIPGSFPYVTLKSRMPVILTKAIDFLHRHITEAHTSSAHSADDIKEAKAALANLNKLKYHMQTGKEMPSFAADDDDSDKALWKEYVMRFEGQDMKWWKLPWLYSECYMYRKIREEQLNSVLLRTVDPFWESKVSAFHCSETMIDELLAFAIANFHTHENQELVDRDLFDVIVQFSLWGNKSDLSMMADFDGSSSLDHMQAGTVAHLKALHRDIISDHTEDLWGIVKDLKDAEVHIILDNSGIELVADLMLLFWLIKTNHARKVVLHGKRIPWFVSDVTERDFTWTLEQLQRSENNARSTFAKEIEGLLHAGTVHYTTHAFWTGPHEFDAMRKVAPDLYSALGEANLLIFKGDLNYRKLVGDRKWPFSTSFSEAIQSFKPTSLVTLRTCKSDSVVDVAADVVEALEAEDKDWNVNGTKAVVQVYHPKETLPK